MKLEEILKKIEDMRKPTKRTEFPVPLPNGEVSLDWSPEIKRILGSVLDYQKRLMDKEALKLIADIDKFRQRYGHFSENKITEIFKAIEPNFKEMNGNIIPHLDLRMPREGFGPAEMKIANRYADLFYLGFDTDYVFCPTSFCYEPDYFNLDGIDKLINGNIRSDEKNKQAMRTPNFEKYSKDDMHKISVSYFMGKNKGIFYVDVKYMAFGLKGNEGKRDKLDLVFRMHEGSSIGDIRHVEIFIPVLNQLNIDSMKSTEKEGIMKSYVDAKEKKEYVVGYQMKTGSDGEKFGNRFLKTATKSIDLEVEEFKEMARNYDQLLKDPTILGGHIFGEMLKHAKKNMLLLKSIYERSMSQKE